jgi:Tfp pilus assembly protein PilO
MNRVLVPLLLIIIAITSFFLWINPHYEEVKVLRVKQAQSDEALDKIKQLETVRAKLVDQENAFNQDDLEKLKKFLPDNVDNIRLFLDIQGIASRYGTSIADIEVGEDKSSSKSKTKSTTSSKAIGPSNKPYGEMTLSFSVATTYENLNSFLTDLEKSLRLVEIKSLSFEADNKTPNRYKVALAINAFWLSPKTASTLK